ncbi:MAG: hypothetical protein QOE97_3215 [Pseudonocardiales bacterium]|jgi:hypothetical protein|nr:hypothetical protein [Pseudonocardiales bacterium]
MNDADKKKLYQGVAILVNMEAPLNNMIGRSARAAKHWTELVKANKTLDEKQRAAMKRVVTGVTKLTTDAKTVLKDLNALGTDAGNAKLLAAAPTAKEFRDKVVSKRLASSKKFDQDAHQVLLDLKGVLGGSLFIGMNDVDVKVTVNSLNDFSSSYNKMRIELAKL